MLGRMRLLATSPVRISSADRVATLAMSRRPAYDSGYQPWRFVRRLTRAVLVVCAYRVKTQVAVIECAKALEFR